MESLRPHINYFVAVVSAAGATAVVSTFVESTAVESALTSVEGAPHATIPTARINAIAPTLAVLKIVDKRFALYKALVV